MPRYEPPPCVEAQRTLLVTSIGRATSGQHAATSQQITTKTMLGTQCMGCPTAVPGIPNDPPSCPPENPQSPRIPTPEMPQTVNGLRPLRLPPSTVADRAGVLKGDRGSARRAKPAADRPWTVGRHYPRRQSGVGADVVLGLAVGRRPTRRTKRSSWRLFDPKNDSRGARWWYESGDRQAPSRPDSRRRCAIGVAIVLDLATGFVGKADAGCPRVDDRDSLRPYRRGRPYWDNRCIVGVRLASCPRRALLFPGSSPWPGVGVSGLNGPRHTRLEGADIFDFLNCPYRARGCVAFRSFAGRPTVGSSDSLPCSCPVDAGVGGVGK